MKAFIQIIIFFNVVISSLHAQESEIGLPEQPNSLKLQNKNIDYWSNDQTELSNINSPQIENLGISQFEFEKKQTNHVKHLSSGNYENINLTSNTGKSSLRIQSHDSTSVVDSIYYTKNKSINSHEYRNIYFYDSIGKWFYLKEGYKDYYNGKLLEYEPTKFAYEYDDESNPILIEKQHWKEGSCSWIPYHTTVQKFDSNNRITYRLIDPEGGQENRWSWIYDSLNNITYYNYETHSGWGWRSEFKYGPATLTYDSNGRVIESLEYDWRTTYTYDSKGNLILEYRESKNDLYQWEPYSRYTFTYDLKSNRTSELFEQWDSEETQLFQNDRRNTYNYDSDNQLIFELDEIWVDCQWIGDTRYSYTYDSSGNQILYLCEEFDNEWTMDWRLKQQTTYQYDDYGNMIYGYHEKSFTITDIVGSHVVDDNFNFYDSYGNYYSIQAKEINVYYGDLESSKLENKNPVKISFIPDTSFTENTGKHAVSKNLNGIFSDPDGDNLCFFTSTESYGIRLEIVDDIIFIENTQDFSGVATIIVSATDPLGLSEIDTFLVEYPSLNEAPIVTTTIDNIELSVGQNYTHDLTIVFSDSDGDSMGFTAVSSDESIVTAAVSTNTLTVTAVAIGNSTITIEADDGEGGKAETSFVVIISSDESPLNDETDILAYTIEELPKVGDVVINSETHSILFLARHGTNLVDLIATFTLSEGATATINGTVQESGESKNNFTSPVTYTVAAEDEQTTQDWTVSIDMITGLVGSSLSKLNLSIYPIPATDIIHIDLLNEEDLPEVTVFNDIGQFVTKIVHIISGDREHYMVWDRTDMNGNRIPSGMYLVRIKLDNEAIVKRVIIQ